MRDLLTIGSAWLEAKRLRHLSTTVEYVRGTASVEVAATVGRTEFEVSDANGMLHRVESRDYLIAAEDLVFEGSETTPEPGDVIRERQGTTSYLYEVMAPGNQPSWRYSDLHRNTLRVHTKLIGTEK